MSAPSTCVLCGNRCDQSGRFCTTCVGPGEGPVGAGAALRVGPARVLPLRILQWPITAALLVTTALAGMRAASAAVQFAADLRDRRDGRPVDAPTLHHLAAVDQRLAATAAVLAVLVAGLWLMWWAFAFANLRPLGIAPREGERWAVLAWLVPLAHFVVPQRVADELWKGSDPWAPLGWRPPRHGRRSAVVRIWWSTWWAAAALLVAAEVGVAALDGRVAWLRPHPGSWAAAGVAAALGVSATLVAVAGLAGICLVTGVTARQAARARMMVDIGLVEPRS